MYAGDPDFQACREAPSFALGGPRGLSEQRGEGGVKAFSFLRPAVRGGRDATGEDESSAAGSGTAREEEEEQGNLPGKSRSGQGSSS